MTYLLAMVTGGMIFYAFASGNPETFRVYLGLALIPGWLTWASWRTERIKKKRGED